MKIVKAIGVILILGIFPGLSWYFLQSGLDWRKDKRHELTVKAPLQDIISLSASDAQTKFHGKTSVVKLTAKNGDKDAIVIDQFKQAYTFQWIDSNIDSSISIYKNSALAAYDYLLIDTGMNVRNFYLGSHDTMFADLVEDLSLIIPKKKELDIKMKQKK